MSAANGLKAFWLSWFSRPAGGRPLYRLIRKQKPRKLMLLGMGDEVRLLRMISLAQRYHPADQIHLAGIDLFDAHPAGAAALTLKEAHRLLRPTGSRINLIPGLPHDALARAATILHGIDVVLIASDQDEQSLSRAWFYLHRLLSPTAIVLREELDGDQLCLKAIGRNELERLAAVAAPRRRAA